MRMKIEEPTFTLFPAEGDDNRVAFGSMTDMNNYLEGLAGEVSFEHVQIPPETVEALNRHGFTCPTKQNAFRVLSESTGTLALVGVIIAHLADGTICDVPCRHCTAVVHQSAS